MTVTTINRIRVFTHCNSLGGKVWNPAIRWADKYAVFVLLEDDQGNQGLGECWCFDSSPELLIAYLRIEIIPCVIGHSIDEIELTFQRLLARTTLTARHGLHASAVSGIDIALWDLRSKLVSRPLWQHFNPSSDGSVFLYGSGGLYGEGKNTTALAQEISELQSAGFSMVKMKVGGLELQADLERVRAVLDALPDSTSLIIDGVYSYSIDEALKLYKALPARRIAAFQSPIAAHDIAGMVELTAAGLPVMATEAEYRPEIHQLLLDSGAVQFLQVAPIACGGFTRLQELCNSVAETPVEISLEVSSTAIALMAACQFAAAHAQVCHVEFHTLHQVFFDQFQSVSAQLQQGEVMLDMKEGLGVALPQHLVSLAHDGYI